MRVSRAVLLAAGAGAFGSLDTSLNIAFPDLVADFDIETAQLQWVVVSFVLTYGGLLLAAGQLGDRVGHRRITSWCGFFSTVFTGKAASLAAQTVGVHAIPEFSQDGYLWYLAKRMGFRIERPNMKSGGWGHWHTMGNVRKQSALAMEQEPWQAEC